MVMSIRAVCGVSIRWTALALYCILLVPTVGRTQELTTIRVSCPPVDSVHPVYYGVQSGLFRKYGLNVEIVSVNSGAAAMASVIGGDTQVANTSVIPLLQAHARGVPLQIVSQGAEYRSEAAPIALYVRSDSPIRTGRDLNGKTIAVQSLRDLNWAATLAWIDQNGGESRTVKVIELTVPSVIPAIEEGRIDAGSLVPPFMEEGVAPGRFVYSPRATMRSRNGSKLPFTFRCRITLPRIRT